MSKKFKSLSMFLVLMITISSILAGCKSNEQATGSDSNSVDTGEPTEITMAFLTFTDMTDLPKVQEEINKITKEKINATINLLPIGVGAWQQQTNLMLTGDEKLDLIVSSSFFNYGTQAVKGQILPLDELVESHGKGIKDAVPSHVLEGTRVDGQIYGIPSVRDYAADFGFIMRKDLVDKHNIDLSQVKTFADLTAVFEVIKQKEAQITPIANASLTTASNIVAVDFDALGDGLGVIDINGNGQVENMFEHPKYVEAVELAREWFEAGYALKDAATSQEAAVNVVKSNKAFGYFNNMKPGYEVQEKGLSGYEMVAVRLTEPYMTTSGATSFMMSIARNSENPEKAMEMMNLLYTDKDVMNLLANGIEGDHYVVKPEGVISLPEGVTQTGYTFGSWQVGNGFITYPWEGNDPNYWQQMEEHNNNAIVSPAFGFTFNPDPVKTEIAALMNVTSQYRVGLESGTLDPAKSLPEFNKKLKEAGLEKVITEKQKQLDEWNANK